MSCPVCTSEDILHLLDVGEMPVLCNQLCSTEEAARSVAFGRIDLEFCRSCGHVFNPSFDRSKVQYSPEYLQKNPNHNVPALEITLQNGANFAAQQLIDSILSLSHYSLVP